MFVPVDGHQLKMKTGNLSTLEVLDFLWEMIDEKDPKKHEAPAIKTKASKARRRWKIDFWKGKKRDFSHYLLYLNPNTEFLGV